jgi:hypothetical protein
MGTWKPLVLCTLVVLAGHGFLLYGNTSYLWVEMSKRNDDGLQASQSLALLSGIYGLLMTWLIAGLRKGTVQTKMELRAQHERLIRNVAILWIVACIASNLLNADQFFSFGAYFLLNGIITFFVLPAFQNAVEKVEKFVARAREANARLGHELTEADALAVFELVNHRRKIAARTVERAAILKEKLTAWQVDDFFTTSCWIHDLEALAAKDPQTNDALRSLIGQMKARCEKCELSDEKRAQFLRLVQLGGPIVVPGQDGEQEVVIRGERPLAIAQEKLAVVSVPINEPPPEYEE